MVYKRCLDDALRAYVLLRVKDNNHKAKDVAKEVGISLTTVYRIKKEGVLGLKREEGKKRLKLSPGRPRKLNIREERMLLRQIKVLREENPNFCSGKLMESCGISSKQVSNRTIRRLLHKNGFGYRQSRKKGVLTRQDIRRRYMYAREVKKKQPANLWTRKIHFYLDGVSFYYKRNPAGQARAPQGRIWRTKHEGLAFGCTARGRKEGSGGKVVKLFVSISHNKGVIGCDPYDKLDGPFFEKYVREQFPILFGKANKTCSRLCVQDGDPSQNAASVQKELRKIKAKVFSIPPRSPDLNPIENLFHLVRKQLNRDAISKNIVKESYEEFQNRIVQTFLQFPTEIIDNIIESMNKRIELVIMSKGNRIKY